MKPDPQGQYRVLPENQFAKLFAARMGWVGLLVVTDFHGIGMHRYVVYYDLEGYNAGRFHRQIGSLVRANTKSFNNEKDAMEFYRSIYQDLRDKDKGRKQSEPVHD